jgi:hypothetical protein
MGLWKKTRRVLPRFRPNGISRRVTGNPDLARDEGDGSLPEHDRRQGHQGPATSGPDSRHMEAALVCAGAWLGRFVPVRKGQAARWKLDSKGTRGTCRSQLHFSRRVDLRLDHPSPSAISARHAGCWRSYPQFGQAVGGHWRPPGTLHQSFSETPTSSGWGGWG